MVIKITKRTALHIGAKNAFMVVKPKILEGLDL